jgi:diguanylate cyclase (GGDEF)-like protein/PAS domain S-box-containing protein
LFLPIIFVLCWIINNEYTEFYNSKLFLDNDARILASSYANQIYTRLDAKFNTLKFIGNLLLSQNRSTQLIDEKISDFIKYLVQFYPEAPAFSIYSSNGQVLWTTLPNKKFVPEVNFIPLKTNPDYQLGLVHKGFFNTEAINERYTVKNSSGKPIYYVRTVYFISNLFSSDIKNSNFNFVVIDNRNNEKIGTLKDGFFIIDTSKTPENYSLSVNIPGYPFEIKVYYPESLIWQNYINSSFERWPFEIIILILTVILNIFLLLFLKNREMNLMRIIDFRSLLSQVNQLLLNVEDESTLLQSICDIAIKFGHLKLAFIARPDEKDVFKILASSGETDYANSIFISANPNIPEGQGLSGRTWREKRSTYSQSFDKRSFNYPWKEAASKFGIKSSATIPIFRNNEIWANFSVYHCKENVFNEDLKNLLEELSMDISLGLDRLDLRKKEKESSEIRKSIIENALIGIALVRNRKFVQVNSKFVKIFGYENTDSLAGKPTKILFFDQDDYDRVGKIYDELFQNKRIELVEIVHKRADGKKIICEVTANVLDENEKTFIWTVQDITERKILEEKLRQSEEDYRLLFENHSAVKLLIDPETGNIFDANYAAAKYYGYSREELKKMNIAQLNTFTEDKIIKEMLKAKNKKQSNFEFKHKRADGSVRDVEVFSNPTMMSGRELLHSIIFDITDRKKAQIELERAYFLLNNIIENLPDATFVINSEGSVIAWNKSLEILTGVKKDDMIGKTYLDYSILFYHTPRPMLSNLILSPDESFEKEKYKILEKNNDTILAETFAPNILNGKGGFLFVAVSKIIDKNGNVIGAIESIRDITENKNLEKKLYHLSIMDPLTSSYNRRYFEQRLEEEIERTKRNKMPFSLIMFDIDDFKTINDTYGHSIGDKVLINIVELVKNRIRKTDFIARWGGEEFMVLLTNTNLQFAEMLALELKNGICKLNIPEIDFVTASFGVTDFHQDDTLNSITKRVDDIMYAAKAAGKNCVKCDLT